MNYLIHTTLSGVFSSCFRERVTLICVTVINKSHHTLANSSLSVREWKIGWFFIIKKNRKFIFNIFLAENAFNVCKNTFVGERYLGNFFRMCSFEYFVIHSQESINPTLNIFSLSHSLSNFYSHKSFIHKMFLLLICFFVCSLAEWEKKTFFFVS